MSQIKTGPRPRVSYQMPAGSINEDFEKNARREGDVLTSISTILMHHGVQLLDPE